MKEDLIPNALKGRVGYLKQYTKIERKVYLYDPSTRRSVIRNNIQKLKVIDEALHPIAEKNRNNIQKLKASSSLRACPAILPQKQYTKIERLRGLRPPLIVEVEETIYKN